MEWHPAGWSVCVPLLISPCTVKSRSSLLASAHPGDPRKRALKRLWCGGSSLGLLTFSICQRQTHCGNSPLPFVRLSKANYAVLVQNGFTLCCCHAAQSGIDASRNDIVLWVISWFSVGAVSSLQY